MKPSRSESHGVYERLALVPHQSASWFAVFQYYYDGLDYDVYFVVGPIDLTEQQAYDTIEVKRYREQARKNFLENVILRVQH